MISDYCHIKAKLNKKAFQPKSQIKDAELLIELINTEESIVWAMYNGSTIKFEELLFNSKNLFFEFKGKDNFFVKEKDGIIVAIDTTMTPELLLEGYRNEIVHAIQAHRKKNFGISDYITVEIYCDEDLSIHKDHISQEVRAKTITFAPYKDISTEISLTKPLANIIVL